MERKLKAIINIQLKVQEEQHFHSGLVYSKYYRDSECKIEPQQPKGFLPSLLPQEGHHLQAHRRALGASSQALLDAAGDAEKNTWSQPAKNSV